MKTLKITVLLLALVMALGLFIGCTPAEDNGNGDSGEKAKLTVILVLEDKKEEKYDIEFTPGKNLREALYEGKLIEEDQLAAMFLVTIKGHSADFMEGLTWMICDEKGEQIMGFIDEIFPTDGQTIKLVYTVVPNFD